MSDMTPQGTQEYSVESGYEAGDANIKAVVSGGMIIIASTLVVMAAMFGMFNYLNKEANDAAARVPDIYAERLVPPEPRLLPMPYSDEFKEARALGATSPDVFPWDKRNLEIVKQYGEANGYQRFVNEDGRAAIRIPIARAIERATGANTKGTPAIMTWQPEHPRLIAGEKAGTMNLIPNQKNVEPATYDRRPYWETQDEKFNTDSSGGRMLKSGQMSR
jgi:hypothetical protein